MNANTLYSIYQTNREHGFHDLNFGLAQFKADHPEVAISHEEDKAIREFIGRHGKKLADGFAKGPDAFAQVVSACEIEDAEGDREEAV